MVWTYAGFIALVVVLLALDLGVFHRKAHVVKMREALGWSAFWISLGLAFTALIYVGYEHHWLGDSFNFYVLGVVLGILATGVVASLSSKRGGRDVTSPAQ